MSFGCGEIYVGRPVNCELVEAKFGVGVFKCRDLATGEVAVIVAQLPDSKNWQDCQPSSAIAPFSDEVQAIDALKHWAEAPSLPLPPKKPRRAGGRRNSNRPRRWREGAGQLMLAL